MWGRDITQFHQPKARVFVPWDRGQSKVSRLFECSTSEFRFVLIEGSSKVRQSLESRFLDHFCAPQFQVREKSNDLFHFWILQCVARHNTLVHHVRQPQPLGLILAKFHPPSQVVFNVSNRLGEMAQIW